MIKRANATGWEGVPEAAYKSDPGAWKDVARKTLFDSPDSQFQVRYFGVAPGGFTSFERHQHEHCVLVLNGTGRVRLGDEWHDVGPNDIVHVTPMTPHRFENTGSVEFGILCVVDRNRDRPQPVEAEGAARASD